MILEETSATYWHWCPGCNRAHPLPKNGGWTFNGDMEKPTFSPSFMQERDSPRQCHYFITEGMIQWCGDGWHGRTGKEPLPELPANWLELR